MGPRNPICKQDLGWLPPLQKSLEGQILGRPLYVPSTFRGHQRRILHLLLASDNPPPPPARTRERLTCGLDVDHSTLGPLSGHGVP